MLTDEEFLCIRQLQLFDSDGNGTWDSNDDCPPAASVGRIDVGVILLNPTSCLDIEFKECNTSVGNRMVLFLFLTLLLVMAVVTALFVGRAHLRRTDGSTKSSAGSVTGDDHTSTTDDRSPTRDLSPLESGQCYPNDDEEEPPRDESLYFPSLSRTLEELRLSYEDDNTERHKIASNNEVAEEDVSVQSPVDIYDDNVSDSSPFRSNSTTGSLSPVNWVHQREAWEEFEHSSREMNSDEADEQQKRQRRQKPQSRKPQLCGPQVAL